MEKNKKIIITESAIVPYVIMGLKAMKQNQDNFEEETKQAMSQLMKGLIDDFDSVNTKCDANEK